MSVNTKRIECEYEEREVSELREFASPRVCGSLSFVVLLNLFFCFSFFNRVVILIINNIHDTIHSVQSWCPTYTCPVLINKSDFNHVAFRWTFRHDYFSSSLFFFNFI